MPYLRAHHDTRRISAPRRRAGWARQGMLAAVWLAAVGGFALYLARFDSLDSAYGSGAVTAASLAWLTLFSVLYYALPSLRREPAAAPVGARDPDAERGSIEQAVHAALADDVAHRGMWSALPCGPDAAPALLSDFECDLGDWGFAYGVAWAVAKRRNPSESDDQIAARALAAARAVFGEYCAGENWSQRLTTRRTSGAR
jgi:hypothetical protein